MSGGRRHEAREPILNPAGEPASDLVRQVMARYGLEHGAVAIDAAAQWVHASPHAAVVAVRTALRTRAELRCTDDEAPDRVVTDPDLHHIHVFYLRGLQPDRRYDCRVTVVDRNGSEAESDAIEVRTPPPAGALGVPGRLPGPPYVLDAAGATYLLRRDLTAPGSALRVEAPGITLDLGGHTVTYDDAAGPGVTAADTEAHLAAAPFGIRVAAGADDVRLVNGTVMQGRGQHAAGEETVGANPILLEGVSGAEIAGVTCVYGGAQLSGIVCRDAGPGIDLHHNVVEDRGRRIDNRHRMCCAIRLGSEHGGALRYNLVRRTRQSALGNAGKHVEVHGNELHIDSHSINAFGVAVKDGSVVHGNHIYGCGNNAVGMVTTGGCGPVELHHNHIWLQAHDLAAYEPFLNKKEMESAPLSVMSGVRITWGCDGIDYHDNVILVSGREGGAVRGTFLYNDAAAHGVTCRDNLVIAIAEDEATDGWGAIAGVGDERRGPTEPMRFVGNTIVSNVANVNLQDTYGVSVNYRFEGNTFVRVGERADYATVRGREGRPSRRHVFLDSRFEGGAGFDRVRIGVGDEFEVGWTWTLARAPGTVVTIRDATGAVAFAGGVGEDGRLEVPLIEFRQRGARRQVLTPYTVRVEADGAVCEEVLRAPRG